MYFITFSEMLGTDGKKIAIQVANALNYTFYGEEELVNAAREIGFLSDIQKLDEKSPPFLEKFFSERPKIYLDRVQSLIYELAKKGNAVFFGRGSQLLLKSFDCALHVLVSGSREKRIERIIKENGVGREIAEKLIDRSDHDKRGFFRFAYDEDWLNPQLYDLILNTDKLSVASAVQMVLSSAKSEEIKSCGIDSVKQLGILSLNRRVESTLLEAGITNPNLFVEVVDPDTIRIYGLVGSVEEKEMIGDTVKKIRGVNKVLNELQIFSGAYAGV